MSQLSTALKLIFVEFRSWIWEITKMCQQRGFKSLLAGKPGMGIMKPPGWLDF